MSDSLLGAARHLGQPYRSGDDADTGELVCQTAHIAGIRGYDEPAACGEADRDEVCIDEVGRGRLRSSEDGTDKSCELERGVHDTDRTSLRSAAIMPCEQRFHGPGAGRASAHLRADDSRDQYFALTLPRSLEQRSKEG